MFSQDAIHVDGTPYTVEIIRGHGRNLETGEASIGLFANGNCLLAFNWADADAVATAILHVTGVARNG